MWSTGRLSVSDGRADVVPYDSIASHRHPTRLLADASPSVGEPLRGLWFVRSVSLAISVKSRSSVANGRDLIATMCDRPRRQSRSRCSRDRTALIVARAANARNLQPHVGPTVLRKTHPRAFLSAFSLRTRHQSHDSICRGSRIHFDGVKPTTVPETNRRGVGRHRMSFIPSLHDTTGCQPLFVQPVVKVSRTTGLTTGCRPIHDTAGCQTGCQTGLTTGCIVYTNIYPVVKPDCKNNWSCVVSCLSVSLEAS